MVFIDLTLFKQVRFYMRSPAGLIGLDYELVACNAAFCTSTAPSRERRATFKRLSPGTWLKTRPKSGLDCPIGVEFTKEWIARRIHRAGLRSSRVGHEICCTQ